MSTAPVISDLDSIEVEHLVSATTGAPLVKVRASGQGPAGVWVLVGQVDPDSARQMAAHLTEAAARAEYEVDLLAGIAELGLDDPRAAAVVLNAVRRGEQARHATTTEGLG